MKHESTCMRFVFFYSKRNVENGEYILDKGKICRKIPFSASMKGRDDKGVYLKCVLVIFLLRDQYLRW